MTANEAIQWLTLYRDGGTDDGMLTALPGVVVPPHAFDLSREIVDMAIAAIQLASRNNVESNIYDTEEIHENCTVQILRNSVTGECSVGWWETGHKILDTHLGSGSSRIAAYDAGLDFVGYEIDETYFELQEQRFAAHSAQTNLFLDGGLT